MLSKSNHMGLLIQNMYIGILLDYTREEIFYSVY
jgi:hypothetical protein